MSRFLLLTLALVSSASAGGFDYDTSAWFKGNTHTHSLWSDGNDFPEMIFDWYKQRDYHFVAMSDHNVLQEGEKWMPISDIKKRQRAIGRDAISKYLVRFGEDWVVRESRDGVESIKLKTLDECRSELEISGEFLLLPAEEVSNSARKKPIHINALNISAVIPAVKDDEASAEDVLRRSLIDIKEHEQSSGNPVLAHVNHPNFQWAVTAEDLAAVAEGRFFEIYNGHPGINHLGDAERPGDQEIWDIANTIRLAELDEPPLFGVATDDSHTYHGGDVSPGRGWVHVGAASLNGDDLVTAMKEGKFYASSGVTLQRIRFDPESRTLELEINPINGIEYETHFIGTRSDYDATAPETGIGEVFATQAGTKVSFQMPEDALYLRATITSTANHPNRSFPEQKEQAWIQPVGWSAN
ncbi:MAG: hypothetical protein P1U58_15050 [Verrucomicrobiales bacterium]|nr:hypothetical protein [Verrucomicrobiales bacterium]